MAKNQRGEEPSASRVAEEAMPGWKVVKETSLDQSRVAVAPDAYSNDQQDRGESADVVMPSLDDLKAKYLGASQSDSVSDSVRRDIAAESADTSLVELESGPIKKTVAVSKSRKKVIWSQG